MKDAMDAPRFCTATDFGHAKLIMVREDLDGLSSAALAAAIDAVGAESAQPIIVSLELCGFCDLSGLRTLVLAKARLAGRLYLVAPLAHPIRRLLALMQLSPPLTLSRTSIEALMRSSGWIA